MAITTMNISLPDSMRAFVDERLESDGYGTASEYIRDSYVQTKNGTTTNDSRSFY